MHRATVRPQRPPERTRLRLGLAQVFALDESGAGGGVAEDDNSRRVEDEARLDLSHEAASMASLSISARSKSVGAFTSRAAAWQYPTLSAK